MRRVGRFDWELARKAVRANTPTIIALNGVDYLDYSNRGIIKWDQLTKVAKTFVEKVESSLGKPVKIVGTGPGLSQVFVRQPHGIRQQRHRGEASTVHSLLQPQNSAD